LDGIWPNALPALKKAITLVIKTIQEEGQGGAGDRAVMSKDEHEVGAYLLYSWPWKRSAVFIPDTLEGVDGGGQLR